MALVDSPTHEENISPIDFSTTFENIKENITLSATSQILNAHAENHSNTGFQNSELFDFFESTEEPTKTFAENWNKKLEYPYPPSNEFYILRVQSKVTSPSPSKVFEGCFLDIGAQQSVAGKAQVQAYASMSEIG